MADTAKEKRSKWGLFHRDNDHKNHNTTAAASNLAPDSAYGSSESSSAHSSENSNHDPSQTVTTTTTTTTTTTKGAGPHNTSSTTNQGNYPSRYDNSYAEGYIPPPSIPAKSSMRRDHSPSGPNFSRPSPTSSPLNPNPPYNPANPHSTALQGLKTAVAGIHGAGETLRGTVNSAVDRQFHAPAGTVAAHEQVANAGRREIESGRLYHANHEHPVEAVGSTGPRPGNEIPRKGILRKKVDDREGRMRVVSS